MSHLTGKTGPALVIFMSVLGLFFWFPFADFSAPPALLKSLGQSSGIVGFTLYAINTILSLRVNLFEKLFFGLNRAYIFHHLVGAVSFGLLLLHPLALAASYAYLSPGFALDFLIPSADDPAKLFGTVSLVITVLVMVFTLWIRLEYDFWKKLHRFLSLGLFFAGLHVFLIGSTFDYSPALKIYVFSLTAIAILVQVCRLLLPVNLRGQRRFFLKAISRISPELISLILSPGLSGPLKFIPGQYVFIRADKPGILGQSHPFSIASAANSPDIILTAKVIGDYTAALANLKVGDRIDVEGPFGVFTPPAYSSRRQIWIAGGIGITPFLSCARSLGKKSPSPVHLFYLTKTKSEAIFLNELTKIQSSTLDFSVSLHTSSDKGYFSIADIKKLHPDLNNTNLFICGPVGLMVALKKQLRTAGVSESHIHTEEFSLTK